MNRNNVIFMSLGLIVVLGLGVYFLSNMPGRDDEVAEMPPITNPSGPGEPSNIPSQPQTGSPDQGVGGPRASEEDPLEGNVSQLAMDFTLKNLEGEDVSLSDFRGKYVFVNFWATWCVYCDLEMPDLQALSINNDDLVVLAVNVREDEKTVRDYIEKGGYTFPVVLDTQGDVNSIYSVTAYPTTFFIDKEGILLAYFPGMLTPELMEEGLKLLREN